MLNDTAIENLRLALARLDETDSCGAWGALEPLRRLSHDGLDIVIDLAASSRVGAPVIVATPRPPAARLLGALTPRQQLVARMILAGHANKVIARQLGITLSTVKDHVHAILGRLGLSSRSELIAVALSDQG